MRRVSPVRWASPLYRDFGLNTCFLFLVKSRLVYMRRKAGQLAEIQL